MILSVRQNSLTPSDMGGQPLLARERMAVSPSVAVPSLPVSNDAGQFGHWLREELTRRGYLSERGGQTRFAKEADIGTGVLSRIFSEENRIPDNETLRRIGRALGYSLGEMLVAAGAAQPEEMPIRPTLTSGEAVALLRREAAAEGKPISELLLDQGVEPEELVIPDAPPDDPEIAQLIALGLSPEVTQTLIRMNLENRARRYKEAREARRRHEQDGG